MENKVVEQQKNTLLDKLTAQQKECFEALDWFLNGGRGAGRTHVACTIALVQVLNGQTGFVLEHSPNLNDGMKSYTKAILFSLAGEIGLRLRIRDVRHGLVIDRDFIAENDFYEHSLRGKP